MFANNYIEKLTSNPKYKLMIALPTGGIVTGYMKDDLALSINSEYNSPFELSQTGGVSDMLEKASGMFGASMSLKTVAESKLLWKSSSMSPIQVTFSIVALNPGDDVREKVRTLSKAVFPTSDGVGGTLKAPMGYAPGMPTSKPVNTVSMKIGSWFNASYLVIRGLNPTFSKDVIKSGLPLYVDISLTLEPSLQLTQDDFIAWIS